MAVLTVEGSRYIYLSLSGRGIANENIPIRYPGVSPRVNFLLSPPVPGIYLSIGPVPVFSFPVTVVCLGALAGITGGGGNALLGSEEQR